MRTENRTHGPVRENRRTQNRTSANGSLRSGSVLFQSERELNRKFFSEGAQKTLMKYFYTGMTSSI